jgi:hypothetical protein
VNINDEIADLTATIDELDREIDALSRELRPYFTHKYRLDAALRGIKFLTGEKRLVESTMFCGTSLIARAERLARDGEIIEPGYFITVESTTLVRNPNGPPDRQPLFDELLALVIEWGPSNSQLRNLRSDRAALDRRREAFRKAIRAGRMP